MPGLILLPWLGPMAGSWPNYGKGVRTKPLERNHHPWSEYPIHTVQFGENPSRQTDRRLWLWLWFFFCWLKLKSGHKLQFENPVYSTRLTESGIVGLITKSFLSIISGNNCNYGQVRTGLFKMAIFISAWKQQLSKEIRISSVKFLTDYCAADLFWAKFG